MEPRKNHISDGGLPGLPRLIEKFRLIWQDRLSQWLFNSIEHSCSFSYIVNILKDRLSHLTSTARLVKLLNTAVCLHQSDVDPMFKLTLCSRRPYVQVDPLFKLTLCSSWHYVDLIEDVQSSRSMAFHLSSLCTQRSTRSLFFLAKQRWLFVWLSENSCLCAGHPFLF